MTTRVRSLPGALRRGLTFWRRSIQARVVGSTLLLSALVVAAVGWFLLRQVGQGLVDHRGASVVADVPNETTQPRTGLTSAPGTETDAATQAAQLVNPIIESGYA